MHCRFLSSLRLAANAPAAKPADRRAFSLVEISIVLAVVSVMLAGLLPYITESTKIDGNKETLRKMQMIEDALSAYIAKTGGLPCPASTTATIYAAGFGTAVTKAGGVCPGMTQDLVPAVSSGSVPTKTLGLADDVTFDGWGRRFTYNVTLDSVGPAISTGAIIVQDSSGAERTALGLRAVYALISHGPNGHGAYTMSGTPVNADVSNVQELENCNCGATGAAAGNGAAVTTLVQMNAVPSNNPAQVFDDIVRYYTKEQVMITAPNCDGLEPGWPDVILCDRNDSNQTAFQVSNTGSSDTMQYVSSDTNNNWTLNFTKTTQAFASATGTNITSGAVGLASAATDDCRNAGTTIATLIAAGKTRNFCTSGGAAGGGGDSLWGETGTNIYALGSDNNVTTGNVGIGTNTPGRRLEIVNDSGFGSIRISGTSAGMPIRIDSDAGTLIGAYKTTSGVLGHPTIRIEDPYTTSDFSEPRLVLRNRGNADQNAETWAVRVLDTGAFNISTMSDAESYSSTPFSISNAGTTALISANIGGGAASTYTFKAYNTTTAEGCEIGPSGAGDPIICSGPYNATSDERLKTAIEPLNEASGLDAVMALRPVHYLWKDAQRNKDGKREIGFIAQEVEKIFPDIVSDADISAEKDFEGPVKVMAEQSLIAPIVLAIQQLKKENDALREEIAVLKAAGSASSGPRVSGVVSTASPVDLQPIYLALAILGGLLLIVSLKLCWLCCRKK